MNSEKLKALKEAREQLKTACEKVDAMIAAEEDAGKSASGRSNLGIAEKAMVTNESFRGLVKEIADKHGTTAGIIATRLNPHRGGEPA
jgi:hypothetical protein